MHALCPYYQTHAFPNMLSLALSRSLFETSFEILIFWQQQFRPGYSIALLTFLFIVTQINILSIDGMHLRHYISKLGNMFRSLNNKFKCHFHALSSHLIWIRQKHHSRFIKSGIFDTDETMEHKNVMMFHNSNIKSLGRMKYPHLSSAWHSQMLQVISSFHVKLLKTHFKWNRNHLKPEIKHQRVNIECNKRKYRTWAWFTVIQLKDQANNYPSYW